MISLLLAALTLGTPAHVVRIVDGDTLVVSSAGAPTKIRVLGIDCLASLPAGRRATARAHELLDGRDVRLEPRSPGEPFALDRYGRTLAYVRLDDGRDFGGELVAEGLCADFGWKYPHPRMAEYLREARR